MSTQAVAYLRRSTDRQEASIPDQRKTVGRYAAEHGYELVREYADDGVSGFLTAKRESFLRMVQDSAKGQFAAVLVYDISRFGRTDTDEAGHYRYLLRQNGVEVVYCTDNLGEGDESDLVRGVLTWQKHKFLIDLARDTSRGMISTAEGGWCAGGRAPYGFRRAVISDDGKLVQLLAVGEGKASDKAKVSLVLSDPAEVEIVRRIFRQFLDGAGYRTIAERLNAERVPSARNGAWASTTIREILLNPHYTGDAVWNRRPKGKFYGVRGGRPERNGKGVRQRVRRNAADEWVVVRDAHPAIIDRAAFEQVQQRIRNTGRNDGYTMHHRISPYPLSGLLHCGCGNLLWGQSHWQHDRHGRRIDHRYYGCSGGQTGRVPKHRVIVNADQIERFVVRKIQQVRAAADLEAEVERLIRAKEGAEPPASSDEATAIRRRIQQIDRAVENATKRSLMVEDDEIAKGILAEAGRLRQERPTLAAKLKALSEARPARPRELDDKIAQAKADLDHLEDAYWAASPQGRKTFLRKSLGTPSGEIGPVVLFFERQEREGRRAKNKLLGGVMGVWPIGLQESLCVLECREGDSNPHSHYGH